MLQISAFLNCLRTQVLKVEPVTVLSNCFFGTLSQLGGQACQCLSSLLSLLETLLSLLRQGLCLGILKGHLLLPLLTGLLEPLPPDLSTVPDPELKNLTSGVEAKGQRPFELAS